MFNIESIRLLYSVKRCDEMTIDHAHLLVSMVGRLVNLLVCDFVSPHVFSRTVAAVDTKRGYVGVCNGRSAQQESGAALSKNSMFTAGAKNYIQLLY